MENVVPGHLQRLRAADIVRIAGLTSAAVGQEYYRSGAVHSMSRRGLLLAGVVEPPSTRASDDTSSKMGVHRFLVEVEFVGEGAVGSNLSLPAPALSWFSKCLCRPDTQGREHGDAEQERVGVGQEHKETGRELAGVGQEYGATEQEHGGVGQECGGTERGQVGTGLAQVGTGLAQDQTLLCAHGAALLYQWLAQPSLFQTQDVSSAVGKEKGVAFSGRYLGEDDQRSTLEREGGTEASPAPTGPLQVPAKSEMVGVKSTHKNEGSDVTDSGRKGAEGAGQGQSPSLYAPPFPTGEQMESPIQPYSVGSIGQGQGPMESLQTLLSQFSLSDLRATAREYNLTVSGMSRQQLVESVQAQLKKPDVVRRVAATLEKSQRQLLAALILAGGVMSDDDLRGLFERFSLGQSGQLQHLLTILQGKALLFRTSLNASNVPSRPYHGLLNSALLDIGWYVPLEVRNALRVSVPITPFDVTNVHEQNIHVEPALRVEQAHVLPMLLVVARLLDGYTPGAHETWYGRGEQKRSPEAARSGRESASRLSSSYIKHPSDLSSVDGSVAMPPPEDLPPSSLLQELQERILSREGAEAVGADLAQDQALQPLPLPLLQPAFLRFIIRVLGVADLFHKEDGPSPVLSLRSGTAERLLGTNWMNTLRTLFNLWLTQTSYGDLYDLTEAGIRLRCRAHVGQSHSMPQHQPVLRSSELDADSSQVRYYVVALLAQAPLNQWINFSAFARFMYRLNPLFLQRRYQSGKATAGHAAPQWWLELEEGRPLRPLQLNDWLRAELFYLRYMIAGPLHWWGVCDIVTGPNMTGEGRRTGAVGTVPCASPVPTGDLLAFRLTPLAGWLFNDGGMGFVPAQPVRLEDRLQEEDDYLQYVAALEVTDASEILVSCSIQNWPVIQLLEMFTEVAGVQGGQGAVGIGQRAVGFGKPVAQGTRSAQGTTPTEAPNPSLRYRISARAFGQALGRGLRPLALLRLLRLAAEVKADSDTRQAQLFTRIATQFEQWLGGYSRVRLYTGVTLLETVDVTVMREVVATTSLEGSIVQNIHPTLSIVQPNRIGQIVEELKQRGQSPLIHDEDL